jgi:hypothetical protein
VTTPAAGAARPRSTGIAVHLDDAGTAPGPIRVGTAFVQVTRGVTSTTFTYDADYQLGAGPGQRGAWDLSPE